MEYYHYNIVPLAFNRSAVDQVFSGKQNRLRWLVHPKSNAIFLEVTSDESYGKVSFVDRHSGGIMASFTLTETKANRLGIEPDERYKMTPIPGKRNLYLVEKIKFKEPGVRFTYPVFSAMKIRASKVPKRSGTLAKAA